MKFARLVTYVIILAVALSVWTPSVVLAKPAPVGVDTSLQQEMTQAKSAFVKLSINNKTGGSLYIRLVGANASYYFAASNPGKSTYQILPGRYTYIITASNCGGSLEKTKNFKGNAASLGVIVCKKHKK